MVSEGKTIIYKMSLLFKRNIYFHVQNISLGQQTLIREYFEINISIQRSDYKNL